MCTKSLFEVTTHNNIKKTLSESGVLGHGSSQLLSGQYANRTRITHALSSYVVRFVSVVSSMLSRHFSFAQTADFMPIHTDIDLAIKKYIQRVPGFAAFENEIALNKDLSFRLLLHTQQDTSSFSAAKTSVLPHNEG